MSRSSLLRRAILAALLAVHPRVYYQAADPGAAFPYLVFDLPNAVENDIPEVFRLEVDGWDDSQDTTALETLMGAVDEALHKRRIVDYVAATVYRDNRLSLRDDDPRLRRRQYVYQVRVYTGS